MICLKKRWRISPILYKKKSILRVSFVWGAIAAIAVSKIVSVVGMFKKAKAEILEELSVDDKDLKKKDVPSQAKTCDVLA